MSGTTFNEECPNCGFDMESYSDWKPVSLVIHGTSVVGGRIQSLVSLVWMN